MHSSSSTPKSLFIYNITGWVEGPASNTALDFYQAASATILNIILRMALILPNKQNNNPSYVLSLSRCFVVVLHSHMQVLSPHLYDWMILQAFSLKFHPVCSIVLCL